MNESYCLFKGDEWTKEMRLCVNVGQCPLNKQSPESRASCSLKRSLPNKDTAESCKTCKFFAPQRETDFGGHGPCRRYPPKVYGEHLETMWPDVGDYEWCGEWEKRND